MGSSPGGGGRRDRSTGSPRLRASKTASKLWEKEDQGKRLQLEAMTLRGVSMPCPQQRTPRSVPSFAATCSSLFQTLMPISQRG